MESLKSILLRIWLIARRELRLFARRPLLLFSMIIVPVTALILFTTVMAKGLPTDIPAGLVDEDDTQVSRTISRTLDAMGATRLIHRYPSFHEARQAMQRGEIYAFFHIPKGTTREALSQRRPTIAFYTNESYFLPGSLLMKDMRLASELLGMSVTRSTLTAKGATASQALSTVQPIVLESHPLGNPWINYGICLTNILVPGLFILTILLSTSYTIGMEWKMDTQRDLLRMAGGNPAIALTGKLIPQTLLYILLFVFLDVYLYKYMAFPCHCGIGNMMLLGCLTVFAAQGMAIFIFAVFPGMMRFAMSVCSLIGVVELSAAGYTYPVTAMDEWLQWTVNILPLRHYYLIYVNQALNGYDIVYVWPYVAALILMALLPILVMWSYKWIFENARYRA